MWRTFGIGLGLVLSMAQAYAQEGSQPPAMTPSASMEAATSDTAEPGGAESAAAPTARSRSRGQVKREKEAEGTEALERFESDAIIKSRYRLNGQPLEVDTD